jgi:hypothetical protein
VFLSNFLGVDSGQLLQVITSNETTDGGWMATVSQPLMESLNLQVSYVGLLESEEYHRLPLFGIKSQTKNKLVLPDQNVCLFLATSTFVIQDKNEIQTALGEATY